MSASSGQAEELYLPSLRVPFLLQRRGGTSATVRPRPVSASDPAQDCYIVIGNHVSYVGIGELLYTAFAYFRRHYRIFVSAWLVPGHINVIIDEFSTPARVQVVKQMKVLHPETKIILIATEFVTKLSFAGIPLGQTFNFFSLREESRFIGAILAHRIHLVRRPPYLHARYCGFIEALAVADLVLCAHPAIAETMHLLPDASVKSVATPLTLYPEIDCDRVAADPRLYRLPAGVVMTGSMTRFRRRIADRMVAMFQKAGVYTPFYQHLSFDQARGMRIDGDEVDLGYDEDVDLLGQTSAADRDRVRNYIYNLNPPQRKNWSYSSPMRILRAILLGQIPVLTHRFCDHEIESVAPIWDGKLETADSMWMDATLGRPDLIERYVEAVREYSRTARTKNTAIDQALTRI